MSPNEPSARAAAIAAHRFGLAEADLTRIGPDPLRWVLQQFDAPPPLDAEGLLDTPQAAALTRRSNAEGGTDDAERARLDARQALREASLRAATRLWRHQVGGTHPVFERWVAFWANHFCVSATKGAVGPLVLPFEREAIRPRVLGPFADLLRAASLHPAMLIYLDNADSVGPQSRAGLRRTPQQRWRGLNENFARELLELHTLGVDGGYRQADVTEAARLLTGWTVTRRDEPLAAQFNPQLQEPGAKTVVGQRFDASGPDAADALLRHLATHPSTARNLGTALARHFVADDPPPALVQALTREWLRTQGDLRAMAVALFSHPAAWDGPPRKLKRPDEWVLSAHRLLGMAPPAPARLVGTLTQMGQPPGRAPSPQGWPDRASDWLGPDALLKRVQWAQRFASTDVAASRAGPSLDARALAAASLGPLLGEATAREIARADSGPQALALLLVSPEFMRR